MPFFMKVVIRGTSGDQSEVLPSYLPKRLWELFFRSEGKKITASRELSLHQPSFLNPADKIQRDPSYAEVNIARNLRPLGKAFFTPNGKLDAAEVKEKFPDLSVETEVIDVDDGTEMGPQYYTGKEQQKLISTCYRLFMQLGNTAYLAIIMCFCLGLRIGELVGLKVTDFDFKSSVVHIRRREITSKDENGKRCFRISKRLKNDASKRDLPLTETCKYIFDLIVADKKKKGIDSDWLFISVQNGDRMHSTSVDMALDNANEKASLEQRSLHKVRKTVLSRLDMSQHFTMERIREIAGHSR